MPAGTYLDSVEIDEVNCRYKTTYDVDVSPLSISAVRSSESSTGKRSIDLSLTGVAGNIDSLGLHIGGDYQGAVDTFFILNHYLDAIALVDSGGNEIIGDEMKIRPIGFDEDFKLLDYPSNSFPAYRLIQEYFY